MLNNLIFDSKFDKNLINNFLFELKMNGISVPNIKFNRKKEVATMATVTIILNQCEQIVSAAPKDLKNVDIEHMLDPLISLLVRFSLPIGILIAVIGGIMLMVGNSEGKEKIKMAIVGLILINFLPYVMYTIYKALPR